MLKKWQRDQMAQVLTTLSQLVNEPLEFIYVTNNDKTRIVSFDKYNNSIILTDDEVMHNLNAYNIKLMNKLSNPLKVN